jgi:hypothetical protein
MKKVCEKVKILPSFVKKKKSPIAVGYLLNCFIGRNDTFNMKSNGKIEEVILSHFVEGEISRRIY